MVFWPDDSIKVSPATTLSLHGIVDDAISRAVESQVQAGIGIPRQVVLFDQVSGAVGEHVKAVHISVVADFPEWYYCRRKGKRLMP